MKQQIVKSKTNLKNQVGLPVIIQIQKMSIREKISQETENTPVSVAYRR
jgi:hypothetical protein